MIDKTGGVDRVYSVQLKNLYKVSVVDPDAGGSRRDAVTISKFSALVERGTATAMALPAVRADRVSQARSLLQCGDSPAVGDVASAMINRVVKGGA